MDWVIIQLTPWAEKTMNTLEIANELRRRLKQRDVEIYYPVIEDAAGKHNTPYSEYIFVEHLEDLPYEELEGNDTFKRVLRDCYTDLPQIAQDHEIGRIQEQICEQDSVQIHEVVEINEGPFRGSEGHVRSVEESQVMLTVSLGDEEVEATLPRSWVRGTGRRRRLRQTRVSMECVDLEGTDISLSPEPVKPVEEPPEPPIIHVEEPTLNPEWFVERVVRRGKFNTRILQNGQSIKLPNEEVARLLHEQENWLKQHGTG